jgi:hypothetical protein
MSNYEGKTYHRKRGHVDLIDLLYYEATGEALDPKDKKEILDSFQSKKEEHMGKTRQEKENER